MILFLCGCQLIDQPEIAPSFISVSKFDFNNVAPTKSKIETEFILKHLAEKEVTIDESENKIPGKGKDVFLFFGKQNRPRRQTRAPPYSDTFFCFCFSLLLFYFVFVLFFTPPRCQNMGCGVKK